MIVYLKIQSKTGLFITVKDLRMLSRERHESHLHVTGFQIFRLQILTEISHSLGLQIPTSNQSRLHEMVVWTCENQKCQERSTSVF